MKILGKTCVLFLAVAGFALAETYTGTLVDASCAAQRKTATCTPTAATTSFALITAGKTVKLDTAGNSKAETALKEHNSGANRSKDPNSTATAVNATVTGTMKGDEIAVESIQVE